VRKLKSAVANIPPCLGKVAVGNVVKESYRYHTCLPGRKADSDSD
jgi:hypothetical protein